MAGYIINLFKYSSVKFQADDNQSKADKNQNPETYLAFGDYDRINIAGIADFTRFRDVNIATKKWIGPRLAILAYDIPDQQEKTNPQSNIQSNILSLLINGRSSEGEEERCLIDRHRRRFFALTMVKLAPEMKKILEYGTCIQKLRRRILDQVKFVITNRQDLLVDPANISVEVYGSFSSSELVIAWTANQYVDVLRLVNTLRYMIVRIAATDFAPEGGAPASDGDAPAPVSPDSEIFNPFYSFCSVFADATCGEPAFQWTGTGKVHGKVSLNIIFKEYSGSMLQDDNHKSHTAAIYDQFNRFKNPRLSGEFSERIGDYDLIVTSDADTYCKPGDNPFHRDRPLFWNSTDHPNEILETKVVLMDSASENPNRNHRDHNYREYIDKKTLSDILIGECAAIWRVGGCARRAGGDTEEINEVLKKITEKVHGVEDGKVHGVEDSKGWQAEADDKTLASFTKKLQQYGLRALIKCYIPESVGLCDSLDLLYTDFVNNCTNLNFDAWKYSLADQFSGVLDYMADSIWRQAVCHEKDPEDDEQSTAEKMYNKIADVIHALNQVIYHVAQSRRTIFTIPSSHLRYMGHYDAILHAYYGVINFYLHVAYQYERSDIQANLVPFLAIDVVPEIKVDVRPVLGAISSAGEKYERYKTPSVLFTVDLPLSAMVNFLHYSMVLAHETFHTITPRDRDRRNQITGLLYLSEYAARVMLNELWKSISDYRYSNDPADGDMMMRVLGHFELALRRELMALCCAGFRSEYTRLVHADLMRQFEENKQREWLYYPHNDYLYILKETLSRVSWGDDYLGILGQVYQLADKWGETINEIIEKTCQQFYKENHDSLSNYGVSKSLFDEWKDNIKIKYNAQEVDGKTTKQVIMPGYDPDAKRTQYRELTQVDNLFEIAQNLTAGFQEAAQDLAMIRMFDLSLVDYLAFRSRHKIDLFDLDRAASNEEICRVGMLCDYMLSQEGLFDDIWDGNVDANFAMRLQARMTDMKESYISMMTGIPEIAPRKSGDVDPKTINTIKVSFKNYVNSAIAYYEQYSHFFLLFRGELSEIDTKEALKRYVDDADSQTPEITKTLRLIRESHKAWKDCVCRNSRFATDRTLRQTKGEEIRQIRESLFNINLNMIHQFQFWGEIQVKEQVRDRNIAIYNANPDVFK